MTIDPHHDYKNCGGPHTCIYCRDILSETSEHKCARITAENRVRMTGWRAMSDHSLPDDQSGDSVPALVAAQVDDYTPPDAYAPQLAKLREQRATPASRFEDAYRLNRIREFEQERNTTPTPPDQKEAK